MSVISASACCCASLSVMERPVSFSKIRLNSTPSFASGGARCWLSSADEGGINLGTAKRPDADRVRAQFLISNFERKALDKHEFLLLPFFLIL